MTNRNQTPLKPGTYWYDTLKLPSGVTAELVVMYDGNPGVRFCFTTTEQGEQLSAATQSFGSRLAESARVARARGVTDPPEIVDS